MAGSEEILGINIDRPLYGKCISIVGAGPGGLASAMLLAHAGAKVTIYERHDRVGGRSAAIKRDGFSFDTGPTFFLYPEIIQSLFARCGFDFHKMVELRRLDHLYDLKFEGGPKLSLTTDRAALKREIAKLDTRDAQNVDTFLNASRAKFTTFVPALQRAFSSPLDLLKTDLLRALPKLAPGRSIDRDLARYFRDPRTRLAFSFQSKYLGMSPYRCPSLFTILSFMEHEFGIYHPVGGTEAVVRAMAMAASSLGVKIETETPVREIAIEGRRARGVVTRDGLQPADAIVVNADFARAMTQLVPDIKRRRWNDKRLAASKYSCSTFMMYLGLDRTFPDNAHHTIFLSQDYTTNFAEIEAGRFLPDRPSLYVQNACVTDPEQAPDGRAGLYVLTPVGHLRERGIDWTPDTIAIARDRTLARLAEAGFGDLRTHIVNETIITPGQWEDEYDVHRGAVFNLAHNLGQMLYWRPHNRFEDIEGVYLAGGGTHPGSGLPVIFEGARISADLLIGDLAPARNGRSAVRPPSGHHPEIQRTPHSCFIGDMRPRRDTPLDAAITGALTL